MTRAEAGAKIKDGTLRIWHVPDFTRGPIRPRAPFRQIVASLEEAATVLDTLASYDRYLGEDVIADSVQGLEVYDDGLWIEWSPSKDDSRDFQQWREAERKP